MTELERAILHIKTRADAWAVKEIEKALSQEPNIDMESEEIKILQKRSYLEGFHEALKMSVKQEPCDDAISREVARKALQNEIDKIKPPFDGWVGETMASLRAGVRLSRNIIEDLPSVTQKSGKWIDREEYDADRWKCSVCGRTEQYKENYCPNCGAKMLSHRKVRSRQNETDS